MMMKSLLVYATQVITIVVIGYGFWYLLYGKPDMPLVIWLLICVVAAALGLIPYLFIGLVKRRRRDGSGAD